MGRAERQAPSHQVIGHLCREQQSGRRLPHDCRPGRQGAHHGGTRHQASRQIVFSRKRQRLVFLQILVVPERQPLHRRQPPGEHTDGATGLAAYKLHRIRILFLRHQARTGGDFISQFKEPELFGREQNHIFRQAAQARHAHRAGVQERCHEVAVTGRIDTVERDTRESECLGEKRCVDRITCTRDRSRAQRHQVRFVSRCLEAIPVAS